MPTYIMTKKAAAQMVGKVFKAQPEFINALGVAMFGRSRSEAWEKRICISCGKKVDTLRMTELDKKEWSLSALCGKCFRRI